MNYTFCDQATSQEMSLLDDILKFPSRQRSMIQIPDSTIIHPKAKQIKDPNQFIKEILDQEIIDNLSI